MIGASIKASDEIIIAQPVSEVWSVVADIKGYPRWWPESLRVRIITESVEPLGADVQIHPSWGRPFRCRVEAMNEPTSLQMRYYGRFIDGRGEWRLKPLDQATSVTYVLDVTARGWLVSLLGRVLDLGRLHSRSMQAVLHRLREEVASKQRAGRETRAIEHAELGVGADSR